MYLVAIHITLEQQRCH